MYKIKALSETWFPEVFRSTPQVSGRRMSDMRVVCACFWSQTHERFITFALRRMNLLTSWSWILLEKLTGYQLVKKFPAFFGTPRFITAFTIASHLSLSWASSIQSMHLLPTSWGSILNYPPIYDWVSQVDSVPQVSPPKSCMRLSSPSVLHAPLISLISILSPEQ